MRNVYYEDIEEKDLTYMQNLLNWYAEMEKKEGKYYQGQKETYTANQDQENQDYIFYLEGWRYGYDEETPEKLEKHIRPLYYQFVHREGEPMDAKTGKRARAFICGNDFSEGLTY